MLDMKVIERVTEPTDWCSPIVPVVKPSGDVQICVDLKRLNKAAKLERYTLPTLEDLTHKFAGATVFSKLDARSGYWQLPLDEETAKLTTCLTPFGRFFFKRLPFGISLASEIFQRVMTNLLAGINGVVCFMDDIGIGGKTVAHHDDHEILQAVMKRINNVGLKLNEQKCKFRKSEIEFLGHRINSDGIRPDPTKVKAILEMSVPKDTTEARRFIDMTNYHWRFLPNLSEVIQSLNALLHKDVEWTWGPAQQEALERAKLLVTRTPTLAFFELNRPTVVCTDASQYGLGGVLYQEHEGELRPVCVLLQNTDPNRTKLRTNRKRKPCSCQCVQKV